MRPNASEVTGARLAPPSRRLESANLSHLSQISHDNLTPTPLPHRVPSGERVDPAERHKR